MLSPIFDQDFSNSSYGFRPGRSADQAVRQGQAYVSSGKRWLLDIHLEKFFDRVNPDILMSRVARGDQRQASAVVDSALPTSGHHGRGRTDEGEPRGNAARRTALAAIIQYRARRSGQRARAWRALVLPLRG